MKFGSFRDVLMFLEGLDLQSSNLLCTVLDNSSFRLHNARISSEKIEECARVLADEYAGREKFCIKEKYYRINSPDCVFVEDIQDIPSSIKGVSKVVLLLLDDDERHRNIWSALQKRQDIEILTVTQVSPPARVSAIRADIKHTILNNEDLFSGRQFYDVHDAETLLQLVDFTADLEGDYVEVGVYKGKSAVIVTDYMKASGQPRNCWFFDTFEGFDYPEAATSSDMSWAGTHSDTSLAEVKRLLSNFGFANPVRLNILSDDLPEDLSAISLLNIDVDLYEATVASLRRLFDLVVPFGVIVIEDYGHTPRLIGAQSAVNEFLESSDGSGFRSLYMSSGQMVLFKGSN